MTRRYTATLTANGAARIISVFANTEEEAREEIKRELSKPGRTAVLYQWKRNGSHVIDTTDEFADG